MKKIRALLALFLCLMILTAPALAAAEPAASAPEDASQTAAEPSSEAVSAAPEYHANAKAALLIDLNTGRTIYEQDADEQVYPASLTKIMTCLLVLENGNLSDTVTITENAYADLVSGSSTADLQVGEQLRLEDLLYCMMVESGNEAANAVAEHIGGTIEDFVKMMNERAYELGCTHTHFMNPHGLHNESHYTTARDLSLIVQAALKSENFRTITNTAEYTLPATNLSDERVLKTTNMLIFQNSGNRYYYPPIRNYEGNDLRVADGVIYINGKPATSYTFKMDYYWMMGDNRDNSADSRYWGFVPEDHIVGTPVLILLSLEKDKGIFDGKIRWNRIFRLPNHDK